MGLLHTSGRELGRYRELQAYWPEINNLDKKSVFYMDFDGASLGLSNKFIRSPKVVIHSRSESHLEKHKLQFKGRQNIETRVGAQLDESIFRGAPYDVLIWWNGPQDKEELEFLRNAKKYFKDYVVFGLDESCFSQSQLDGAVVSRFLDMALAVERSSGKPVPVVAKKPSPKPKVVEEKPKPKPKTKPKAVSSAKPLKGRDVTTGEMKTEQSSQAPTNISSKSAKVQPTAVPHQEKVAKEVTKKRSKPKAKPRPKVVDVEKLLAKSNDQSKMEMAFMLNGDLPNDVEEAELIIRSASQEDLLLVS